MSDHECNMVHVGPDGETQCVKCGEGSYDSELVELDSDAICKLRSTVTVEDFKRSIESWLAAVRQVGYIVRIEQVPCEPLAIGNHRDVVTVHEVRK